jgi:hypothetical protein
MDVAVHRVQILRRLYVLASAGEPARPNRPSSRQGPVRVHTHTTICAHSPRQIHKVQTHIVSSLHPGPGGHARLDCNYTSFCGELDARLHALDNTMSNVRKHLRSKLDPKCQESEDRRTLLNEGLHTQMALSTAVFGKYCQGVRPCTQCHGMIAP